MPIYEYICSTCRNKFDRMGQMSTSNEKISCPECGTLSSRAFSVFSATFKSPGGDRVPSEVMAGMGSGGGCNCGGTNCC